MFTKQKNGYSGNSSLFCKVKTFVVLSLVLILGTFTLSCGGYKQFNLIRVVPEANANVCFSLEYPSYYRSLSVDQISSRIMVVSGSFPFSNKDTFGVQDLPDIRILITAFMITDSTGNDLGGYIENDLKSVKDQANNELQIMNRFPISVASTPGKLVEIQYILQSNDNSRINESISIASNRVYLEKNGYFWRIIVDSQKSSLYKAKLDFQHLLDTFQFSN